MSRPGLFAIDIGAEVATLSRSQVQGPWQIPAELVRLALARGAREVAVDRCRRGVRLECDVGIASRDELGHLATVFDDRAPEESRQAAIAHVESAGLEPLLWAAGTPGARLDLISRDGGDGSRTRVRGGRVKVGDERVPAAGPSTELVWSCRGLRRRRALAWVGAAARFAPAAIAVRGRPVARGFPDGLYRMRIEEPLAGELTVTATGDAPTLWLLMNGVLATRAVVPGYPAFSAAVEMSGVAPPGTSADELRTAANPYLPGLIDQAVRMLLRLVDRLPELEEPAHGRIVSLLLQWADRGLRRGRIMAAPIVRARVGSRRRMVSAAELAGLARERGGVLAAVEPGGHGGGSFGGPVVEASAEIRGWLARLVGCRFEPGGAGPAVGLRGRLVDTAVAVLERLRGRLGRPPLPAPRLSDGERRLVAAAAGAGCPVALSAGRGGRRRRGDVTVIGRERAEVRAAVRSVAADEAWIYPALLALAGSDGIDDELRRRWLDSLT